MQTQSRIPKLSEYTFDGALLWFAEMQCRGLLFHPEDDPSEIVQISDGAPLFNVLEVQELSFSIQQLEKALGSKKLNEAAYPIFMKAFGNRLDA